jgi:hypothetical protein
MEGKYIDAQGNVIHGQEQEAANLAAHSTPNFISNMLQQEKVSNFISQTSPVTSLENIGYILRGYVYDSMQKGWVSISDGIPEKIRLDFLQFITSDLSEDVRMTNLSAQQINGIMYLCIEWTVDYLDANADEMNLPEDQLMKIATIINKSIFYTLLRAMNGIERSKMFGALSLDGTVNQNPPELNKQDKWWQFWR